jgi:hypothetical protein
MKRKLLAKLAGAIGFLFARIEARYGPLYMTGGYRDEC